MVSVVAVLVLTSKRNVPLSEKTARILHAFVCHLVPLAKLALPDISYYLSEGRYLIHICIVTKRVNRKGDLGPVSWRPTTVK